MSNDPGASGGNSGDGGGNSGGPSGGPTSIDVKSAGAAGAAAGGAGGAPGGAPAGDIYKPDGIAPELIGKSNNETIDNLLKINKGFRDAQATRGNVPQKADAYAIGEIPAPLAKKLGGDLAKDPALGAFREVAHELGITDKQFSGLMPKLLERFDKLGLVPDSAAFDPETQIGELEKDHQAIADPRERRVAAAKRIPEVKAKLDNLLAAKVIDKGEHGELMGLLPQAKTFRLLEKIVGRFTQADGSINPGSGGSGAAGVSEADITARRMDPKYDTRSPKYDANFREETDRLWREFTARKNRAA
jgi:hypothetical protein